MNNQSTQSIAYDIIKPVCDELGYVLVEVSYKKEFSGMILWVVIDKPEGITLEDCEKLSRSVDQLLDDADVTNGQQYNLNVSSYGLDRCLKTDYDFNKFNGKDVIIKFYTPYEGQKEIKCVLIDHDLPKFKVIYNKKEMVFEQKNIASIKPYIEF